MSKQRFIQWYHYSRAILVALLFFAASQADAQYQVRLVFDGIQQFPAGEQVYAAGNFNTWNPADINSVFRTTGDKLVATIANIPAGVLEFKLTRGKWDNVETGKDGADISNRIIRITGDTTITVNVAGWKDQFATVQRQHTASAHVIIFDTAFAIPQLHTTRRIWIYLPEGYATSGKRYPVLYLQDGQNVFDSYTSAFGEWGVDECLDSLIRQGKPPCIVVAVDNGPHRMTEYNPFDNKEFGKAEGDSYVDFLALTLKPFIDGHFRTLASKDNRIIAGSSMGGLISYYAMLKYPDVFGKAGIFSPSFWIAPQIRVLTDSLAPTLTGKIFFYMGELEGGSYVADMKDIAERLGAGSRAMIYSVTDPVSSHNEQAWRKWFDEFYTWIIADGFNKVIETGPDKQ